MTNKLPEVGKRYRHKDDPKIEVIVMDITYSHLQGFRIHYNSQTATDTDKVDIFFKLFEEFLDSQEKSEVQLTESIVLEVEKAKEQLKGNLRYMLDNITGTMIPFKHITFDENKGCVMELMQSAQNLIDTLEAEKKPDSKQEHFNKVRDFMINGGVKLPEINMDWAMQRISVDNGEMKVENLSYADVCKEPEGKNQEKTKKEEKPQSIWKPVSELPEKMCDVYIRMVDGEIKIGRFYVITGFYILYVTGMSIEFEPIKKELIENYATLTDFINDIEQTKLDHEKRLRKLEGNDI